GGGWCAGKPRRELSVLGGTSAVPIAGSAWRGCCCQVKTALCCCFSQAALTILFDCFFTTFGSQVRHLYICDFHKNFIQSVRNKRKRKTSDDGGDSPEHDTDVPEVDLFQLQVNTLRRYKRHYKLQTRPGLNKAQLAETVSRHFRNIPVNEKETLAYFIYMVKNNKSRLDQKSEGSKQLD
uniref:SAP30 like n=1 Tax=Zonotrichia albicollis TaxID=44394 RepID=A0A8D2MUM0_ZONAL